jgi:hypothetical protein
MGTKKKITVSKLLVVKSDLVKPCWQDFKL